MASFACRNVQLVYVLLYNILYIISWCCILFNNNAVFSAPVFSAPTVLSQWDNCFLHKNRKRTIILQNFQIFTPMHMKCHIILLLYVNNCFNSLCYSSSNKTLFLIQRCSYWYFRVNMYCFNLNYWQRVCFMNHSNA